MAQPGATGGRSGLRRARGAGISQPGRGAGLAARSPERAQADGGGFCDGRAWRLRLGARRNAYSSGEGAAKHCPRSAEFLRHRQCARRIRDRRRGQAPDGPAYQGGRKPSASSKPRRHRRLRASASARFLRSGSGLGDNGARLPLRSIELADRFSGAASKNRGEPRQWFPHPYRRDHLADPGRAARCAACTLPGSPLAPVAGDLARKCCQRALCLRTASQSNWRRNSTRRTSSSPSTAIS